MLCDVDLRQSVIQSRRGDQQVFLNTTWTLQIIRGGVIWSACAICAALLAWGSAIGVFSPSSVYAEPQLPAIIAAMALSSLILGFQSTKSMTSDRHLNQRQLAVVELIAQGVGLAASITAGYLTRSIWSFVFGALVAAFAAVLLSHWYLRGPSNRFRLDHESLIELLSFGRWVHNAVIQDRDVFLIQPYLFRDGLLRAAATSIEPIAFGFVFMTTIGAILAANRLVSNRSALIAVVGLVAVAMVVSLSRGPWLGTAVLLVVFASITTKGVVNLAKLAIVMGSIGAILLATPLGDRIVRFLPFVGSVDTSNEEYRSRLIDATLVIVSRNPLFGSLTYRNEPEMAQMIQGQGIIDIVNTYAALALDFGLVGLSIFLAIFLSIALKLIRICFATDGRDQNAVLMRALIATLAGILRHHRNGQQRIRHSISVLVLCWPVHSST